MRHANWDYESDLFILVSFAAALVGWWMQAVITLGAALVVLWMVVRGE